MADTKYMTNELLLSKLNEALALADAGYRTAVAQYEDWSDPTVDRAAAMTTASRFSQICSSIEHSIRETESLA